MKRIGESPLLKSRSDMIVGPAFRTGNRGARNCGGEKGVLGGIVETRTVDMGMTLTNKSITVNKLAVVARQLQTIALQIKGEV